MANTIFIDSRRAGRADAAGRGSWGSRDGLDGCSTPDGSRTLITSRVHHVALLLTRIGLVPSGGGDRVGICMAGQPAGLDVQATSRRRLAPIGKRWESSCIAISGAARAGLGWAGGHTHRHEAHCIAVRQHDS